MQACVCGLMQHGFNIKKCGSSLHECKNKPPFCLNFRTTIARSGELHPFADDVDKPQGYEDPDHNP